MIFLSYSHQDKSLIRPIAETLRKKFGVEHVFFDEWSIQPGNGIIDEMNRALSGCKLFFFFVSNHSLSSEMVKLEWQNALMKKTKEDMKFIPIKLDDCQMPAILLQNLYINLHSLGLEFAERAIIDVIEGKKTYRPEETSEFQNVKAYLSGNKEKMQIEFRAEAYLEPNSSFLILVKNKKDEINFRLVNPFHPSYSHSFIENIPDLNGINAIRIRRSEPLTPGFPFKIELSCTSDTLLDFQSVMKEVSQDSYRYIPFEYLS